MVDVEIGPGPPGGASSVTCSPAEPSRPQSGRTSTWPTVFACPRATCSSGSANALCAGLEVARREHILSGRQVLDADVVQIDACRPTGPKRKCMVADCNSSCVRHELETDLGARRISRQGLVPGKPKNIRARTGLPSTTSRGAPDEASTRTVSAAPANGTPDKSQHQREAVHSGHGDPPESVGLVRLLRVQVWHTVG